MMKKYNLAVCFLITTLFFFPSTLSSLSVELGYIIENVELTVFRDGVVHVTQSLIVNDTLPSISFNLLSPLVENLIVVDENQTVLDYELDGENLTVFNLGAEYVSLEYDTVSLTEKESGVWTLIINNSYDLSVQLPVDSTIVYLNDIPASIETEGDSVTLFLSPSDWEISYLLPIISSAVFRVSDIEVSSAEVEVGNKATISVFVTNIGEIEGSYDVVLKINGLTEDVKSVTLDPGGSTKVSFEVVKDDVGDYIVEIGKLVIEFSVKEAPLIPVYAIYLIVISVLAAIAFIMLFRWRRKPSVNKIFNKFPFLREEDKKVVSLLGEKGGEAFESEIRDSFPDMPRTTLWRLIRRLEKMEIVNIKKIGLQNRVELKK